MHPGRIARTKRRPNRAEGLEPLREVEPELALGNRDSERVQVTCDSLRDVGQQLARTVNYRDDGYGRDQSVSVRVRRDGGYRCRGGHVRRPHGTRTAVQ